MENGGKKTLRNLIIVFLVCLVVMGGAFYFSRTYLEVYPIKGDSMENTLFHEDFALLFKTKNIDYDDVIIFWEPGKNEYLVKRVIGLPGDEIEIIYSEDSLFHVYRNGERLSEEYIKEPMTSYSELSVTVPEGKVFFLGDNRMISYDSHIGNLYADISDIKGVAFLKYRGWKIKFL